ncbi:transposase [Segniliparus rugosus]|uniref:Transposase n=1 Tax=Segniliparus rugosus (strain ATCC BAA-974 / DSM 45345 / CCUG 50838 / CIP 108380 / JCM 13579 / CDC 945) TaxID=679197 RepID=E5XUU4_SEGRC|nr:transposase [Segniliparus rugosus]EFV11932.1 hypothetical protein HMPREF9336_03266 [Segniliparus rugosus ATCC BAA-974]
MNRSSYPPEIRTKVLNLVESGRKVSEVARDLGINQQTVYSWHRQARRLRNRVSPVNTPEAKTELGMAKRRIAQLEAELDIYRFAFGALHEAVPQRKNPAGRE